MKTKVISVVPLITVFLAVIIMILPKSAYLAFPYIPYAPKGYALYAPENWLFQYNPDELYIEFYSYFSRNLYNAIKYAPPITAYLSVILAILHCVGLRKSLRKTILCVSYICAVWAVLSFVSLLRYPLFPAFIAFLLVGSAVFYSIGNRQSITAMKNSIKKLIKGLLNIYDTDPETRKKKFSIEKLLVKMAITLFLILCLFFYMRLVIKDGGNGLNRLIRGITTFR